MEQTLKRGTEWVIKYLIPFLASLSPFCSDVNSIYCVFVDSWEQSLGPGQWGVRETAMSSYLAGSGCWCECKGQTWYVYSGQSNLKNINSYISLFILLWSRLKRKNAFAPCTSKQRWTHCAQHREHPASTRERYLPQKCHSLLLSLLVYIWLFKYYFEHGQNWSTICMHLEIWRGKKLKKTCNINFLKHELTDWKNKNVDESWRKSLYLFRSLTEVFYTKHSHMGNHLLA